MNLCILSLIFQGCAWGEVLRFSASDTDYCFGGYADIGSRMPAMFTHNRNGSECAPPYWIEIESGRKKLKSDGSTSWIVEGNKTKWEWNSNFYIASQIGDTLCYMKPLNLSAQSWIKIEMNQYKHFDKVQNEFIPTLLPSLVNFNILI